jgi:uncharacterized protein YidB (DUF937 family)
MAGRAENGILQDEEKKRMTMFDSIIAEADKRFNLGGKAGTLLSALLALMTDGTRGGLAGFTEKFNQAGLGDTVSSWVNSGANTEISGEKIESVLGANALRNVANQTGLDYEATAAATAFMTPRVVDALTPEGAIPADGDLMSRVGGFSTGAGGIEANVTTAETFDRIGTAAETVEADRKNVRDLNAPDGEAYPIGNRADAASGNINHAADNPSPLQWLLPLLLLGLLLVIGYLSCSKPPEPPASAAVNINTPVIS